MKTFFQIFGLRINKKKGKYIFMISRFSFDVIVLILQSLVNEWNYLYSKNFTFHMPGKKNKNAILVIPLH